MDLPAVNAVLNGLAAVLLVAAYVAIRRRRIRLHQGLMIAAFSTSVVFLASYLYYHFVVKDGRPTHFTAEGWPKATYLTILLTHTILAVAVAVLAPLTLYLGFGAAGESPQATRPLDDADLALRFGHRRGRVLDAVPALPADLNRG